MILINNKSKQPISTDNLIIFPSCILDGKYRYTSDTKYSFSSKNYFRGKWSSVHQYKAKQILTYFFLKYQTKKLSPRKKGNEQNVKIMYTSELKYLKWQETTHTCTFYTMMWMNKFEVWKFSTHDFWNRNQPAHKLKFNILVLKKFNVA